MDNHVILATIKFRNLLCCAEGVKFICFLVPPNLYIPNYRGTVSIVTPYHGLFWIISNMHEDTNQVTNVTTSWNYGALNTRKIYYVPSD
jgi:hypothetical protein